MQNGAWWDGIGWEKVNGERRGEITQVGIGGGRNGCNYWQDRWAMLVVSFRLFFYKEKNCQKPSTGLFKFNTANPHQSQRVLSFFHCKRVCRNNMQSREEDGGSRFRINTTQEPIYVID